MAASSSAAAPKTAMSVDENRCGRTVVPTISWSVLTRARGSDGSSDRTTARRSGTTAVGSSEVVRTTSEDPHRAYRGPAPAPFLTREAAAWLVARGIDTLVLDLPSADRADDGGRPTAHRVFFGLPPGSRRAADSARPRACITELAWIAAAIPDGLYLLDLQLPAFVTDAAPSRPLLFAVRPA